jgi:hypothetical protein
MPGERGDLGATSDDRAPDLVKWSNPEFWLASGCITVFGVLFSFIGVIVGIWFALAGNTDGLLLVIVGLLAAILFVMVTKGDGGNRFSLKP